MWNFSMTGNLRCFKLYRIHVKLVENNGLQSNELKMAEMVIEENKELIAEKWNEFFNKNKKTEVL